MLTFRNKVSVSPADVNDDDAFALKIVAVAYLGNRWAAYQGPADWTDTRVAKAGAKLTEETACGPFYVLQMSGRVYNH